MRVFQRTRPGGKRTKVWSVAFRDGHRVERTLSTNLRDKADATRFGVKLERLVAARLNRDAIPSDLLDWIARLPARTVEKLVAWDIISAERLPGTRPLSELVDEWAAGFDRRGSTERHRDAQLGHVRTLLDVAGCTRWHHVTAEAIDSALHLLREKRRHSARTRNSYLESMRAFCLWMVAQGRADKDPIRVLAALNVQADRRVRRRAATVEEIRALIAAAEAGPVYGSVPGPRRALVYRVAVETGIRAGELCRLLVSDLALDLDPPRIDLRAEITKARREAALLLRRSTAEALRGAVRGRLPTALAFPGLPRRHMAEMLKADLMRAQVPFRDESGRQLDFHSLRHTTATWLARSASVNATRVHLRHTNVALTLGVYGHAEDAEIHEALEALPDLSTVAEPGAVAVGDGTEKSPRGHGTGPDEIGAEPRRHPQCPPPRGSIGPPKPERGPERSEKRSIYPDQGSESPQGLTSALPGDGMEKSSQADPSLSALVAAWPNLTPTQRAAILRVAGVEP